MESDSHGVRHERSKPTLKLKPLLDVEMADPAAAFEPAFVWSLSELDATETMPKLSYELDCELDEDDEPDDEALDI